MPSNRYRGNKSVGNKLNRLETQVTTSSKSTADPHLSTGVVQDNNLAAESVSESSVANRAITEDKIARGAIGTEHLGIVNIISADSDLQFKVGSTTSTLDASGRLTLPSQPIISGQIGTASNSLSSPAIVAFGEFWVSGRGITYNSTTKRFTVPVAGVYRITMNPFTSNPAPSTRVLIGINTDSPNPGTGYGHCYKQVDGHQTLSLDSVVSLGANDYIIFYLYSGTLYNSPGDLFNQFTIEKIA